MKFAVCLIIFVMFETSESAPFPPSIRKGVEYLLPSRLFYKPKKSTPYSGESVEQVQGELPNRVKFHELQDGSSSEEIVTHSAQHSDPRQPYRDGATRKICNFVSYMHI